jgi:hypothetical protein
MSAKMMRETEHGLALVPGADPSWWSADEEDMMKGLPTPAKVRSWWKDRDPDPERLSEPRKTPDHADHADQPRKDPPDPHSHAGSGDQHPADQSPISDRATVNRNTSTQEPLQRDRQVIGDPPISESRIDNGDSGNAEGGDRHDRADRHFSEDEAFPSVAAVFAEPPDWLPARLKIYRQDPERHFRPLCAVVSALVLGDPERGEEVAEEVRKEVGP